MKMLVAAIPLALTILSVAHAPALAQMTPEAIAALQRPIEIEREEAVSRVPLASHMGKLSIDAALNGVERRFIFDSGSPTLISQALADELGLKVIGTNTGIDANGREVTTDIAVVERLTIGTTTFRNVPVLIADFTTADPYGCFFNGGVIGSEVFPGSAWHIDAQQSELQIAGGFSDLTANATTDNMLSARLYDFGYPHAPIFDYSFKGFSDRGLFDTGSSETITLFDRIVQDAQVRSAIIADSVRKGRGVQGVSAAGLGENTDLLRFDIDAVHLGEVNLGRLVGTTRIAPPSLIGLGILDTHSVTLDYPEGRIILHPQASPQANPPHPGYALMNIEGEVRVIQLFDDSAAQQAGLQLGDAVVAIVDNNLSSEDTVCETTRWLIEQRPTQSAQRLTVLRDGERLEINLAL